MRNMMGELILVRHGESEWNRQNLFTGYVDVSLSLKGVTEAISVGEKLKNIPLEAVFTSVLLRAELTAELIYAYNRMSHEKTLYRVKEGKYSEGINESMVPLIQDKRLNERYYGSLQGMNKDKARMEFGTEQVEIWRRSFDTSPPGGESLKETCLRVIPYFQEVIEPVAKKKIVLVSAHGNSLRALIKVLEGISDEDINRCEIKTGEIKRYHYKKSKWVQNKEGI